MPGLLSRADLVIGAPGTSSFERAVPSGKLPIVIALLATAAATGPGIAADLGFFAARRPYDPPMMIEERPVATVVPACHEARWAVLLRCRPREEVAFAEDADLVRIERSLDLPRRRPYPELVPR